MIALCHTVRSITARDSGTHCVITFGRNNIEGWGWVQLGNRFGPFVSLYAWSGCIVELDFKKSLPSFSFFAVWDAELSLFFFGDDVMSFSPTFRNLLSNFRWACRYRINVLGLGCGHCLRRQRKWLLGSWFASSPALWSLSAVWLRMRSQKWLLGRWPRMRRQKDESETIGKTRKSEFELIRPRRKTKQWYPGRRKLNTRPIQSSGVGKTETNRCELDEEYMELRRRVSYRCQDDDDESVRVRKTEMNFSELERWGQRRSRISQSLKDDNTDENQQVEVSSFRSVGPACMFICMCIHMSIHTPNFRLPRQIARYMCLSDASSWCPALQAGIPRTHLIRTAT